MIKSYLKTTFRNLWKNKVFSLINIIGLGLGMACSLMILLWVQDELSINAFHKNKEHLFSVYERVFSEGKVDAGPTTPGLLASELKRKIPEIQYATGLDIGQAATFQASEKIITMAGACADSDFFKMFTFPLLQGTASTALSSPDQIAISRKTAEIFFGSAQKAIGKTMRYNDFRDFQVSAVFEDVPPNSSYKFDFIFNWQYHLDNVTWLKEWIYRSPKTFISLYPTSDPARVEAKIKNFLDSYVLDKTGSGFHLELGLQPLDQMYLHSNFKDGKPDGGRIEYVQLFSLIAIFILLIACINFMNLSTARSLKRAKEIGIRKTLGSDRQGLIFQFICEAIFISFLGVLLSLFIVSVAMPAFNSLTGKQIELPFSRTSFWGVVAGLILITGLVSGSYPALFLSSFPPVTILKKSLKFSSGALLFRKGLVVFQFSLSILMIIGTIAISRQVNYIQNKNLGFNRENLLYLPFQGDLAGKYDVFKQEISRMPGIKSVSRTTQPPERTVTHGYDLNWSGKNPNTKVVVIHCSIGYDFFKTMDLPLKEGREFSRDFPTDSAGYIINETALKFIGYKDPVGQPLSLFQRPGKIIGVVKDFHFNSLHEPIQPLVLMYGENVDWGYALIRARPGKTREAIASIEKVYKQMEPRFPFSYLFADEQYRNLYKSEQVTGRLSQSFALLAIIISCLGLLGLSMFTAEQRTKEIGVRKVLGASVVGIVIMLSKEILFLIIVSAFIASPVAWIFVNQWLQNYAYRTNLSGWIFLIACLLAFVIALATISYQAFKAALANPIKSLRIE